jgi:hypothetical protein
MGLIETIATLVYVVAYVKIARKVILNQKN